MQIVITEGRFQLLPIEGMEEGTRAGFYFNFTDNTSGITCVASLPYDEAGALARAILADLEAHPKGNAGGNVEVASVAALHNLEAHRKPGGNGR